MAWKYCCLGSALALLALAPATASAQAPPRVRLGAGLGADLLVGVGNDFLDGGANRFLMVDLRLDALDRFHIRGDGSWSGLVDDEVQITGAHAENDLFAFVAGPQFTARFGRLRPYLAALVGVAALRWQTDVPRGIRGGQENGGTSNFAYGAHTGLGLTLHEGDYPVVLQFESRLLRPGELDFARAPNPEDSQSPVGLIGREITVLTIRLGVTIGI